MAQSLLSASLSCEQEYGQIADCHIISDTVANKSSQNDWVRKTHSVETKYPSLRECIRVLCNIPKALLPEDQMFLTFFLSLSYSYLLGKRDIMGVRAVCFVPEGRSSVFWLWCKYFLLISVVIFLKRYTSIIENYFQTMLCNTTESCNRAAGYE